MIGNLEEARSAYLEAARIGQEAGDIHLSIVLNLILLTYWSSRDCFRQAARIYSETSQMATRPDGQKSVIAGRVCVELSQSPMSGAT
jgi:hypothetical protein